VKSEKKKEKKKKEKKGKEKKAFPRNSDKINNLETYKREYNNYKL